MLEKYLNKITHADCLEVMKQLPDKCIDLILTDPPYGLDYASNPHSKSKMKKKNWDKGIPDKIIFDEMFRVSKNQIIFGGNYFPYLWNFAGRGFIFWNKFTNVPNFADGELAWTSFNKVAKCYNFQWSGFIKTGETEKAIHPTQKPLKLFEMILRDYVPNLAGLCSERCGGGGLVAVFWWGSGTTAIGWNNLGLPFICVEIDPGYYELSVQRLKDVQAQLRLF